MASALKAKGYHYQFVYAKNAGHTEGKVMSQTLPQALEYLWKVYPIDSTNYYVSKSAGKKGTRFKSGIELRSLFSIATPLSPKSPTSGGLAGAAQASMTLAKSR
jgi:hypothetical protein